MTRLERVVSILDDAIGGTGVNIGLSRDQFVNKKAFGKALVVVGNRAESNLVKALKGDSPFGSDLPSPPPGATTPRMPAGLPPASDVHFCSLLQKIEPVVSEGRAQVPITVPAGAAKLVVRIWDPGGPRVRTLVEERNPQEGHRVLEWDRTDNAGRSLAPYSYIWRVTVDAALARSPVVRRVRAYYSPIPATANSGI